MTTKRPYWDDLVTIKTGHFPGAGDGIAIILNEPRTDDQASALKSIKKELKAEGFYYIPRKGIWFYDSSGGK
jgi:hypothetical protein